MGDGLGGREFLRGWCWWGDDGAIGGAIGGASGGLGGGRCCAGDGVGIDAGARSIQLLAGDVGDGVFGGDFDDAAVFLAGEIEGVISAPEYSCAQLGGGFGLFADADDGGADAGDAAESDEHGKSEYGEPGDGDESAEGKVQHPSLTPGIAAPFDLAGGGGELSGHLPVDGGHRFTVIISGRVGAGRILWIAGGAFQPENGRNGAFGRGPAGGWMV